jgi:hypothetical protein
MSDYNSSLPVRTENAGDIQSILVDGTITSRKLTVNADGSINTNTTLSATDLDIRDLSHTQDSVKVGDGTDFLAIAADGSIAITDNGGSLTVDGSVTVSATNLDIRDLSHSQDSIKIGDGTDFLAVAADGSIAITDNGGSLTVDGSVTVSATDLDVRDLSHTQDSIKIGDGSDFLAIAADGSIAITDNGGSLTVDGSVTVSATDLDIRDLSAASDSVKSQIADGSGNYYSASNPVPVTISNNNLGDEVNDYSTASAIAAAATSNHDYTVTAGKTLLLAQIEASASGKAKIEVQIESGVASGVFNSRFVMFNSTANPNMQLELKAPISVSAGVRVRVIRTNKDNQSQDLYSTISGQEV